MKILVFSRSEWADSSSFGNTLSNFFGGTEWKDSSFANIYMRANAPDTSVCSCFYQITTSSIIKNIFTPSRIGREFYSKKTSMPAIACNQHGNKEQALIRILHKIPSDYLYFGFEKLLRSKKWENEKLIQFIKKFNPDILFTYFGDDGITAAMIEMVKKYSHAKIVLFAADDVVGAYQMQKAFRGRENLSGVTYAAENADYLYAISTPLCNEYEKMFGRKFYPLQKGCQLSPLKTETNSPLRFIYAGNLLYGRGDTLAQIASYFQKVNQNGAKAFLEIYTGTEVDAATSAKLNLEGSSKIMGQRPYEEICSIMHHADVVLQVESFEPEQIKTVCYSFSTKITDCLQSGTASLAIGPREVASIDYMGKVPGVYVADTPQKIDAVLEKIIRHPEELLPNAKLSSDFAAEHLEIHAVRGQLHKDLQKLLGGALEN